MTNEVVLLAPTELQHLLVEAATNGARAALAEHKPQAWMSPKSAADYLDMSPAALEKAAQRGQVKSHRNEVGRRMFRREELDAYAVAGDNS